MKKRGFTLIELLAVILILGIIALIAIPTVNNIIKESRRGAFETTANNIVGAVEAACELQNLKGEVVTTTYTFADGNVSPILNIKGTLPTGGIITVDSNCNVTADLSNGTLAASKSSTEDSVTVITIKGYTINVSLTGSESINIIKGSAAYVDMGATAIDTDGVNLTSSLTTTITKDNLVVDTIATDATATYEITYSIVKHGITYSKKRTVNITYAVYANGTAVYFNPVTGLTCTAGQAVSTIGTKTGCMKWYTFYDGGSLSSTINLILDHNTTAKVAWNSSGSNVSGPTNILTQLSSDTSSWAGVPTRTDTYSVSNGTSNYTINYSTYKARLITAVEVAVITGNTSFNEKTTPHTSWFYFDSNNQTQTATTAGASNYDWLFDYTHGCTSYGCSIIDISNYGYWTSTAIVGNTSFAWIMSRCGGLGNDYVISEGNYDGVRPVISLQKSSL